MLQEILTKINVYICKVGMPPSHPSIFSFYPLEWVNYFKSHAVALPEIKNQQVRKFDETCRVRTYAYVKKAKNRKINDEKGCDKQNTARFPSTMKNKTHFSLWVFDCNFQDDLLILISISTKHDLFVILHFCKQI